MKKSEYYTREYDLDRIPVDPRFKTAFKEMWIVFAVWFAFAGALLACSYGLGKGDPKNYTYVFGLPLWFFASVLTVLIFMGIVYFIVNRVFVNFSLDDTESK